MNIPIRVLQIGMHDQMGGIENFLMNYYRNMNRKEIQFDFLIPYKNGGYYDNEIKSLSGKIYYFTFKNDKRLFKFLNELNVFFKNNKYDIVHCNDTGLGFLYLYFAKKYKCKVRIAHSHATSEESGIKGFIKKILKKIYIHYANTFFACSTEAGNYLFDKSKFDVISNSIDYRKYYFNNKIRNEIRTQLKISSTDIVLGNIGRFCEQKNQLYLIDIMKKLPENYKLLIIGEGPLRKRFEEKVLMENLESRIIILDPREDVYKYYNAMDLFVLPSLYEGLPIVGVEAQVNGLQCLFSDTITREVSIDDISMFLDIDDIDTWISGIRNGRIARTPEISNKFSIYMNAKQLEEKYKVLLKSR